MNQLKISSLLHFAAFCMVWKYHGIVTTEDRVIITVRNKYRNRKKCLQMRFKSSKHKQINKNTQIFRFLTCLTNLWQVRKKNYY